MTDQEKQGWTSRNRNIIGAVATVGWLVFIIMFTVLRCTANDDCSFVPNLLGDFLAGFAAPVAFLWLILGYFQQADQLELQRKELEFQRKELALQREETARLADESKRQADAIGQNELHARKDIFFRMAERFESEAASVAAELLVSTMGEDWISKTWSKHGVGDRAAFFDKLGQFVLDPERGVFVRANVPRLKHIVTLQRQIMVEVEKCDPDGSLARMYERTNLALLAKIIEEIPSK